MADTDKQQAQPTHLDLVPLDRLLTLTNAGFAVAIILPVLGIPTPHVPKDLSRWDSVMALHQLTPGFLVFGVNFLVVSLFWLGQHRLFRRATRYDPGVVLPSILLLLMISFMPWSTKFAVANDNRFVAALSYNLSMLACAAHLFWLAWVCERHGLTSDAKREKFRATVTVGATLLCVGLSFVIPQWSQVGMLLTLFGRRAPARAT